MSNDPSADHVFLYNLSKELERETGYDSIATIKRIYLDAEAGSYPCVFPDCHTTYRDPVKMWKHVHFGKHGQSFGASLKDLIAKRWCPLGQPCHADVLLRVANEERGES